MKQVPNWGPRISGVTCELRPLSGVFLLGACEVLHILVREEKKRRKYAITFASAQCLVVRKKVLPELCTPASIIYIHIRTLNTYLIISECKFPRPRLSRDLVCLFFLLRNLVNARRREAVDHPALHDVSCPFTRCIGMIGVGNCIFWKTTVK